MRDVAGITLVAQVWLVLLCTCSRSDPPTPTQRVTPAVAKVSAAAPAPNPDRNAYFGDLHVHTGLSLDAFAFGVRASPDDAYRFAKGEPIRHPAGFEIRLNRPLDFEAVTDHAEYLGMLQAMADSSTKVGQHPIAQKFRDSATPEARRSGFEEVVERLRGPRANDDLLDQSVVRSAWADTITAAERNYAPGTFTTFIGYEFTASGPDQANLHRNVIFRGSAVPDQVFSSLDSANPVDLWDWMETQRAAGRELLAIPHNSNGSNGLMFELTDAVGRPIDAGYADLRMRNEPLTEVTQVKGTSDTHPMLSPNDEWADFEIFPLRIASTLPSNPHGSYVREAYLNGLAIEEARGVNPYRFGLIGSSDTHVAAGSYDEANLWSQVGLLDATPQLRGSVPLDKPDAQGSVYSKGYFEMWSASGLAGVWAERNTREAIFDALRRKETFATSGPRIRVRFFAGYDVSEKWLTDPNVVRTAYASGVPMGSELAARAGTTTPGFFAWALRDPESAPLQRLQIIKGWVAGGKAQERVFDVACSKGEVDPSTRRCADNGAKLDPSTCAYGQDAGAAELRSVWRDPDFDPAQRAFYYVRVLENPTCRWSTWDAIRAGVKPRAGLPTTLQERAWSSPIWYRPS